MSLTVKQSVVIMLKFIVFLLCFLGVHSYFTLPGKCPNDVAMDNFRLNEFYGKWYQAYYYSSDGQKKNNCSTIEFTINPSNYHSNLPMVFFNQSRVDRGLFHRYSIAKVSPPASGSSGASVNLKFDFDNAPRRLKTRRYQFHVLASNYNYYATAYTCQYSPLINKHFMYVWILSRKPTLNDVSKELAVRPLQQIGLDPAKLVKADWSKCTPKYYDDFITEPATFRYPVPI